MKDQGKISFTAAVLMNINIIVGSGIYANPQFMSKNSGALGFLGWPIVAVMLLPIIWAVAQAARVFPGEGGFYNYCKTGINETAGFVANWAYLLGYMGTAATIASIIQMKIATQCGCPFVAQHPFLFYLIFITMISLLNLISIEIISKIQSITTIFKLIPLFFIVGLIFFYWNPNFNYTTSDFSTIGGSLPWAIFGYWGFESCCSISHLIKGGSTQASKVILVAFAICTALYTIFHLGVLHIMGLDNLVTYGAQAFPQFMGLAPAATSALLSCISFAIMLSFVNTTYGASLGNIININGMAKRGYLFGSNFLAKTTRKGIAVNAIIIHAIAFLLLITLIPNTGILTAVTNFGVSIAFFFTLIAVARYNIQHKDHVQLLITLLGFISLIIILYFTWTTAMGITDNLIRLMYATPIIIGVPLGLLMYKYLKKHPIAAIASK
jgi:amino acid transporter